MGIQQDSLTILRMKGYRITPQRELIIRTLESSNKHVTVEEIFSGVQKTFQSTNIATVYRTLEMLFREGLACRNDLGKGKVVYASLNHGRHIHLVCRRCGKVIDADFALLSSLRHDLQSQYRFRVDISHLTLYGLCEECQ